MVRKSYLSLRYYYVTKQGTRLGDETPRYAKIIWLMDWNPPYYDIPKDLKKTLRSLEDYWRILAQALDVDIR